MGWGGKGWEGVGWGGVGWGRVGFELSDSRCLSTLVMSAQCLPQ